MTTTTAVAAEVCPGCDERVLKAAAAIRHHATKTHRVLQLIQNGLVTEENKKDFKAKLWASFNAAQSAWGAYCEHLIEHGILPEPIVNHRSEV